MQYPAEESWVFFSLVLLEAMLPCAHSTPHSTARCTNMTEKYIFVDKTGRAINSSSINRLWVNLKILLRQALGLCSGTGAWLFLLGSLGWSSLDANWMQLPSLCINHGHGTQRNIKTRVTRQQRSQNALTSKLWKSQKLLNCHFLLITDIQGKTIMWHKYLRAIISLLVTLWSHITYT